MYSSHRLVSLRFDCFLLPFHGEFFGHGFLELFSIHSIAFGGLDETSSRLVEDR